MRLRPSHLRFTIGNLRGPAVPGPLPIAHRPSPQSGVALIVTIIMLAVITFLAVAFLALSSREKGSTKTATNQMTAKQGAEAGLERLKAELVAGMLATTNPANFGFVVSTNYINALGFQTAGVSDQLTNVNYTYGNGNPISLNDSRQLLVNLLYSPRVPVFITNRLGGSNEFRYYFDLNRNGRHDPSGLRPVISDNPALPYYNTNGVLIPGIVAGNTISNRVQGDPEWIGILDRPNQPHGPENRFTARIAYAAVPIGKTLDVNYIHNQALAASSGTMDPDGRDFFRNQGVGAWEINLAAFLHDLNTNTYAWGSPLGYSYDPVGPPVLMPASGLAFEDAGGIYRYRVKGNTAVYNYNGLESVANLYGANGIAAFDTDWVDGYTDSTLLTTNGIKMPAHGYVADDDVPSRYWVGADNTNHLFSMQDFFDRNKIATPGAGLKIMDRLAILGTNASTYDQYTFYRLLEQLGTDSAPEDPNKLNLNYVNVGGIAATNFVLWTDPALETGSVARDIPAFGVPGSVLFFTNAADRLLRSYTTEWLAADRANYTNTFKIDEPFGVTGIPVYVNGQMCYTPAVQRILQMAANMWDAKTNRHDLLGPLPTVFAPRFAISNNNAVYISGYVEVFRTNDLSFLPPLDLTLMASNSITNVLSDSLVFGVPLVIGARKGLPNFNEFALDTRFTIERKLELVKSGPGGQTAIVQTNQLYTLNVSVEYGAEFWNSYRTNYSRPVDIVANNRVTIALVDSNYPSSTPISINVPSTGATNTALAPWPAWSGVEEDNSFLVPFRTNVAFFVPRTTGYWPGVGSYVNINLPTTPYEVDNRLLIPNYSLEITNRVQAAITDRATGQIIDYVILGDMTYRTNLLSMFGQIATSRGFTGVWATNAAGTQVSGRLGVLQQILISGGNSSAFNTAPTDWEYNYGTFPANRASEIAKFGAFFMPPGSAFTFNDPATGEFATAVNSSNRAYTPFNPSVTFTVPMSWQANDPLVHYMGRDMLDLKSSGIPFQIKPTGGFPTNAMQNLGMKNNRYLPWPTDPQAAKSDPDAYNLGLKDPLARGSDDWQFPTNTLPTLGWLGRVHRGTPWQTIYLKSSNLGLTRQASSPAAWVQGDFRTTAQKWANWTGNRNWAEGYYTLPVMDRVLFDEFTTELSANVSRGRLPINQTGLAAWSALFSGMVVLTNDRPATAGISAAPQFSPLIIQPAGAYNAFVDENELPPLVRLVEGINRTRSNTNQFANGSFQHLGDILAVPELTEASPFLNRSSAIALQRGLNDAAYEWLPQQMMSLVQLGSPRFVVYSYGQALQPAPDSIIPSGTYAGLCTNYAITAEVALRAVVKIVGSPDPARTQSFLPVEKRYPPRAVVESFNYLGPE